MKTEMKVLLYLKRKEQNDNGLCPLMGKITVKSKGRVSSSVQLSCKIDINPKIWNATSQRCTGKSHIAIKTNREIESQLLLLRSRFNELYDLSDNFSATDVKNNFQGIAAAQMSLLRLYREHNEAYALRVGVDRSESTFYQYRNTYRLLEKYIKVQYKVADVSVKSLDTLFAENFNLFLKIDEGQKPNTRIGHINRLKSVVFTALNRAILSADPFDGFSPDRPEQTQRYLSQDELSRLMNTTFDTPNRNFTRDMFIFTAFTGIGYCDMCNLTEANITTDSDGDLWISTHRQKTGTAENVRLLDVALTILEKYRGTAKEGKLFPMLQNTSMNPHLKKIAQQCGIKRNLHYHQARHTFASQICLSQGVPIETVSRAMGHKNISTTQRYAKVTNEKIDKDVTTLHDTISDKYSLSGIDSAPSTILKDMSRRKSRPAKAIIYEEV